jgi:hypothetical protein
MQNLVDYWTCQPIYIKAWDRPVATKFDPQLLIQKKEENCFFVTSYLFQCAENDKNFLQIIITGDETSVCSYNPKNMDTSELLP